MTWWWLLVLIPVLPVVAVLVAVCGTFALFMWAAKGLTEVEDDDDIPD